MVVFVADVNAVEAPSVDVLEAVRTLNAFSVFLGLGAVASVLSTDVVFKVPALLADLAHVSLRRRVAFQTAILTSLADSFEFLLGFLHL